MKRKKIFISGKVSGLPYSYVKLNFNKTQELLEGQGFIVWNPIKNCHYTWSWWRCMIVCLWNLTWCNSVYFLHNWYKSRGSKIEHNWAKLLGKELIFEEWKELE